MEIKLKHFDIFWKEAVLFILTQVLGIFVAIKLSIAFKELKIESQPISLLNFLIYFFIVTLIIVLFFKISKKGSGVFLEIFFILALVSGLDILFGTIIVEPWAMIISICLIIFRFIYPVVIVHNLVIIGGLSGVGGLLGLNIIPRNAIVILIILAIYDVVAVYKTKHMVKMAKEMIKTKMILGIIIPEKFLEFKAQMTDVEQDKISIRKTLKPGTKSRFMILGSGDLVLPLMLIASVARQNILHSIIILIFAAIGLLAMHLIFIKLKSRPMPALPPLAIFSILGYLVSLLI